MTSPTCPEVEAQIELYAVGECDPDTRSAIDRHLPGCPACSRSLHEARALAGLLDLHGRAPEGLRRLQARIDLESRGRRPPTVLPFLKRVGSLAALLLATVGLAWSLPAGLGPEGVTGGEMELALLPPASRAAPAAVRAKGFGPEVAPHPAPADGNVTLRYPLDLGGKTPAAFRRALRAEHGTGRLPPPPAVNLALALRNSGPRAVRVLLGGDRFELRLDLLGPGVVRVTPRHPAVRPFPAPPRSITLGPGEARSVPITRLADRAGDTVHYLYWTEAGVYTLTARMRAEATPVGWDGGAGGTPSVLALTSRPITLQVQAAR